MPYTQTKPFDQTRAGTKKGYCLQNVRLGFGISSKYNSAWDAWQHTEQHKNRSVPKNVDVPLYYDYTDKKGNRDGHVNVRLKNGTVWSDGSIYASIDAYLKVGTATRYVGWGESVNDVNVIKGEEMIKGKSPRYWYERAVHYRKRTIEEKARVAVLQKQLGQKTSDNEFNAIGKALVEVLAKFGYKKTK